MTGNRGLGGELPQVNKQPAVAAPPAGAGTLVNGGGVSLLGFDIVGGPQGRQASVSKIGAADLLPIPAGQVGEDDPVASAGELVVDGPPMVRVRAGARLDVEADGYAHVAGGGPNDIIEGIGVLLRAGFRTYVHIGRGVESGLPGCGIVLLEAGI